MRGKERCKVADAPKVRITPAYAGKRIFRFPSDGEITGSPPPMRGKVRRSLSLSFNSRITPAYAGKRIFFDSRFRFVQDHPRLCGEKLESVRVYITHLGSPPPMRGKVSSPALAVKERRITPAYAGKSANNWKSCGLERDHPRLCGEKQYRRSVDCFLQGSPPPMRGKVFRRPCKDNPQRITPAYAGKSLLLDVPRTRL